MERTAFVYVMQHFTGGIPSEVSLNLCVIHRHCLCV